MPEQIIWTPQPRQKEFMSRSEFEVMYGGAAGGGKSDALVIEALRQIHIPHYRAVLFRKTIPDARNLIDKTRFYYNQLPEKPRYNSTTHNWKFKSGAEILIASMPHEHDRYNYQGSNFNLIAFDEVTHFSYDQYMYLRSRCRPSGPGAECYVRCTGNPGGIGMAWVKARFITAGAPGETLWEQAEWATPEGKIEKKWLSRSFIPSTVFDNPKLLENDPMYIANLASLPEAERNALLYGDWNTFSGQCFSEWKNVESHYDDRTWTHVINPFRIPKHWTIMAGFDWGYTKPFSVGWYAVDEQQRLYRIREFYGCTGTPNTGIKLEPEEIARKMKQIEADDPNLRGRHVNYVGDPAIWSTANGHDSIGELMLKCGVDFRKGDHARISGKMQVHNRLAFDENGFPMLYIFNTCKHFIRTFPNLVYSESDVEDINTDGEDHIYDELRYVCMEHPITRRPHHREDGYDPTDPFTITKERDHMQWYRL